MPSHLSCLEHRCHVCEITLSGYGLFALQAKVSSVFKATEPKLLKLPVLSFTPHMTLYMYELVDVLGNDLVSSDY